ncbi:hypothetical protein ACH49G_24405 [Streptomyces chrestomyceticus]|uniref:hypothetical protein n=1 Tax=Streptomyces chrestomyceticus TaxID=68185 RepID=UPI003793F3E8
MTTTDPATLAATSTWYLANLPRPGSPREALSQHAAADLTEVVRIYGLRHWVGQSYQQVKEELGWAGFQVRSDIVIRRRQTLVNCTFSFCRGTWFAQDPPAEEPEPTPVSERGRTAAPSTPRSLLAPRHPRRPWLAGPRATLQRCWRSQTTKPPPAKLQALLNAVATGRPLDLYRPV